MFRRSLLPVVRPRPSDAPGLLYDEGIEEDGIILSGTARVPATGETYPVKNGYPDLLKGRIAGDNDAQPTKYAPAARPGLRCPVSAGCAELLKRRFAGDAVATLPPFLPPAARGYEPLWRVRS